MGAGALFNLTCDTFVLPAQNTRLELLRCAVIFRILAFLLGILRLSWGYYDYIGESAEGWLFFGCGNGLLFYGYCIFAERLRNRRGMS